MLSTQWRLPDGAATTESRAYETKRVAQGKTHRDVRRSLKRALARQLYRRIQAATRTAGAFNGLTHAA